MALYRKYRPATLADVVGQEHVTDPLRTALDTGRISHAYLFSGPRGCGKTSSARILARSLNCVEGPTSTPCGTCTSCVSLAPGGGGNLDVIELDAASHGGVDDTRELRDRAFYAPAESRYRVFIVDEAHMVTTAGFNALLKIVEEPPEHLIFVFATTEPEKVLPTIRSRTHHYPFRLLPPATMRGLLGEICAQEQVAVEDAVYPLVIRAGGGSPRDSLSVLDQLLAGAGSAGVTYGRAVALLGVTDVALIDEAIEAVAERDGAGLFGTVDRVMEAGHDPRRFAVDLLERLRDLILMQAVPDAVERGLVAAPGDLLERMSDQAARIGPATLTRCAELLHSGLGEMRGATAPRLLLEVVCSRMLLPAADTSDAATLQRLEQLEQRVVAGVPVPAAGPPDPVPDESAPARPAAADPSRRRGAEAMAALRGAGPERAPTGTGGEPRRAAGAPASEVVSSAAESGAAKAAGDERAHTAVSDTARTHPHPTGPTRPEAAVGAGESSAAGPALPDPDAESGGRGPAPEQAPPGREPVGGARAAGEDYREPVLPEPPMDSGRRETVPNGSSPRRDPVGGEPPAAAGGDREPPLASAASGVGAEPPTREEAQAGPGHQESASSEAAEPAGAPGAGGEAGDGSEAATRAAPAGPGTEGAGVAERASDAGPGGRGPSDPELLAAVEAAWSEIKVEVKEYGPTIGAMLTSGASVAGVESGEIVLAHHAALVQRLSQEQPLTAVRSAVGAVLGSDHPVRWVVAGQQAVSRGPGGRERGGRRSGDADSGDSEGGRRGVVRRSSPERGSGAGHVDSAAGPGESSPTARGGASPPRFSRPSRSRGAGGVSVGDPYADIPPPDGPDLPEDPGPQDYGDERGAVPASTPEEEQEMLAEAGRPVAPGERRDPDEVALELLASELGAIPLNG